MDEKKLVHLRATLDEMHSWPALFMFKFILPSDEKKITSLKLIFGESAEFTNRLSKKGNYTSITVKEIMLNADAIFERYTEATKIEGIISL
tara:strand:- start:163 stop:435 length:273 start_codon:yes stop_codon:yes gene_type:complete